MNLPFTIAAVITLVAAGVAMSARNLVHVALSLVVAFGGLAALFLQLNAEFVGFVQILVYVGAVAILIVFAILLTRSSETAAGTSTANSVVPGLVVAGLVLLCLRLAIQQSPAARRMVVVPPPAEGMPAMAVQLNAPAGTKVSVRQIGDRLMHEYVLPLEVMGLLLTAAMIGAVIIAMPEKRK